MDWTPSFLSVKQEALILHQKYTHQQETLVQEKSPNTKPPHTKLPIFIFFLKRTDTGVRGLPNKLDDVFQVRNSFQQSQWPSFR